MPAANSLSLSNVAFLANAGPSFVGPLDDYTTGLARAWSVPRRLLTSYEGPLIRVRRSLDDEEEDFYPLASGGLDTSLLLDFCGGGDGFIVTIYSQLADGLDLTQATAAAQRRIVSSGVLETLDGLPTARATGAQGYATPAGSTYTGNVASAFVRASIGSGTAYSRALSFTLGIFDDDYISGSWAVITRVASSQAIGGESGGALATLAITYDQSFVASSILDGANNTLRVGAASDVVAFSAAISVNIALLGMIKVTSPFSGDPDCWSEGAVYHTDKTADEAAIRAALTP